MVLDVGCGAGYGTDYLASSGAQQVLGIDISSTAITYAQLHYQRENLTFRVMDGTSLDFADKSLDIVVAFEVIEHLNEQEKFLSEVVRILKHEGLFLVSTPNKDANAQEYVNPFHTREFTIEEFRNLLVTYFKKIKILSQNYILGIIIAAPNIDKSIIDYHLINEDEFPQDAIALCSQSDLKSLKSSHTLFPISYNRNECLIGQRKSDEKELKELHLLIDKQQFDIALEQSKRHFQDKVNNPEWHYLVGFCLHMQKKDLNEALQWYNLALEKGFDEFWVRYNRGALYLELGNIEEARADLTRARDLNPEHSGLKELIQRISLLQPFKEQRAHSLYSSFRNRVVLKLANQYLKFRRLFHLNLTRKQ
jgi:SAM-dependent methyltransferase